MDDGATRENNKHSTFHFNIKLCGISILNNFILIKKSEKDGLVFLLGWLAFLQHKNTPPFIIPANTFLVHDLSQKVNL